MLTKQKDEIQILTKALKESPPGHTCPSPKLRNYRELKVVYACTAGLEEENLCLNFSPGGNGNCTLRAENGSCLKQSV
jgi:hypothetical protein